MIRPALMDSIAAMRRALRSAAVEPDELSAVLLVGGSSRIPLVAQLVANELGRPVAVDADPTNAIALGAALFVARQLEDRPADDAEGAAVAPPVAEVEEGSGAPVDAPTQDEAVAPPEGEAVAEPARDPRPGPDAPTRSRPSRLPVLAGVGLAVILAAVAGYVVTRGGGDPDPAVAAAAEDDADAADDRVADETVDGDVPDGDPADQDATSAPTDDPPEDEPVGPVPTPCPTGQATTACIVDLVVEADGGLTATYVTAGYTPELEPVSDHIHFYFDTVVGDDERNAGTEGSGGDWRLWDAPNPFTAAGGEQGRTGYTLADADAVGAEHLCSIVARPDHSVVPGTGNCIAIPRP